MTKLEKLNETRSRLKNDFVGLDKIIDQVIDLLTPWYLTPEILERPVIISLWGLTGTGKTSLLRKLVNYLDLSGKSLFYDCGEQGGGSDLTMFSEKLDDLFESSGIQENDSRYSEEELSQAGIKVDLSGEVTRTDPINSVFVFDEFQYLNTKNPTSGEEEKRPETRAIWSLLDSGLVDINCSHYRLKSLITFLEDIEFFVESFPGIEIGDGRFSQERTALLKQQLQYYRWNEPYEENDETKGLKVLGDEEFGFLVKKLNLLQRGLGFEVGDKLKSFKVLDEYVEYIKTYIDLIAKPKIINCSKSLIFVLGNLDEAFGLTGEDLDPDIDADVYHESTSRVTIMDIKRALRKRFRDEQVGRLGNNLIIYPSLRRQDFEEIINKEVTRILGKFKGHDLVVTDNLKKLMYAEGCYPIQGCRPLFTTINSILSPLLSIIILSEKKEKLRLDVDGNDFNTSKINLVVETLGGERIGEKEINLTLGALRSPERCSKIALQAVHEASHAVLYYLLTRKTPSAIIASNVFGDGGYMMEEIEKDVSTTSKRDLRNDIIVSLAGYFGEKAIFEDETCSLGAGSDIDHTWKVLRNAFYNDGFIRPLRYSEKNVSVENSGLPFGWTDVNDINNSLGNFFSEMCIETQDYIKKEKMLILQVAKYLSEKRSMGTEVFLDYVKKYGKTFDEIQILEKDYYINKINHEINNLKTSK